MAEDSSVNKHWSEINEKGAILGMRIMFIIYKYLGRFPFYIALLPVIGYFFLTNRAARNASMDYISRVKRAGVEVGSGPALWLSYRQFYSFGCSLVDKLAVWSGRITLQDLHFYGYEIFEQYHRQNIGTVIIGSHLGNIEVCRALANQKGALRINVLVHTKHAEKFNAMLKDVAGDSDVNLIQVTDIGPATAMMLNEKIMQGEHVVIAGDRTPVNGKNTCVAEFFGENAHFPRGPLILASILKCPVFTMFCLREGTKYGFYVEKLFDKVELPRKQRETELESYISGYAKQLQKYCGKAPLQWYNFYPFWNDLNARRMLDEQ
ncbi:Lipid A biosynthesis lauroyltransferase [Thalassocella blandensis]|nr:Lipid A biosynthesis lauroyltransferase [Thalassocella blandensis]